MKKNRSVFAVFIILALIALILWLTQSQNTFRRSFSDFALEDSSSVTRIFIGDKNNNSVILTKVSPGKWVVNEKFPAQKLTVELLLKTMVDLQVQQPVANAAHDNIVKELAVNAVKVEIYQWVFRVNFFGAIRLFPHEKLTKVYYVGGATQSNLGCFMLMENSSEPFVVFLPGFRGFVSPCYSPIEKYWRDYNIFKKTIPEIASVRIEVPSNPDYSYEVRNKGKNRFSITALQGNREMEGYDTLKLLNFLSGFRNLNYEALLNEIDKARKDSILSSQPFIIITLTDTCGVSKTIRTYHKPGPAGQTDTKGVPLPYDMDRLYASDGPDFVLIQYFTFDKVLRPRPFFEKENTRKK